MSERVRLGVTLTGENNACCKEQKKHVIQVQVFDFYQSNAFYLLSTADGKTVLLADHDVLVGTGPMVGSKFRGALRNVGMERRTDNV